MALSAPTLVTALLAALLLAGPAAAEVLLGPVAAEVLRVTDGDSLTVRARIWLGQDLTVNVRLAGIDAPETRSRCPQERALAAAARTALASRAPVGAAVRLVDIRTDKYGGRVLARLIDAAGADIGAALVASGFARSYDGRARAGWCAPRTAQP